MTADMDGIILFDAYCCIIDPGDGYFRFETEKLRLDVKLRVNANNVKLELTAS